MRVVERMRKECEERTPASVLRRSFVSSSSRFHWMTAAAESLSRASRSPDVVREREREDLSILYVA